MSKPTGKQRASLIPQDYYRTRSPIDNVRTWLTVIAIAACAGWLAYGFVRPQDTPPRYNHGPIARVHQTWENNCEACHEPFKAINDNTWMGKVTAGFIGASGNKCGSCHGVGLHHDNIREERITSCGGCHHDHGGRDNRLSRMSDVHCTNCHANIPASLKDGVQPKYHTTVSDFTASHPEFKPLTQKVERKLKFSHRLHMTAGMMPPGTSKEGQWTLGKIKATNSDWAEVYRAANPEGMRTDDSAVQLNCASCHQLDSGIGSPAARLDAALIAGLPHSPLNPPRAAGEYFLPVNYERHCMACHDNSFDGGVGKDGKPVQVRVPHRVTSKELREYVDRYFTGQFPRQGAELDEQIRSIIRDVAANRPSPRLDRPALTGARQDIDSKTEEVLRKLKNPEKTEGAVQTLRGRACAKCHEYDTKGEVVPPRIPDVWFTHAKFSHVAHRNTDCRHCHASTYVDPAKPDAGFGPADEKDPLPNMLGIESCKECHSPARMVEGKPRGGVRYDCVDCHKYHNGDYPLQGLAAPARDPAKPFADLDAFFRGGVK